MTAIDARPQHPVDTNVPAQVPTPRLLAPRAGLSFASVVAPPIQRRAPIWDTPVPHTETRAPAVWLLGAHGGAGVTTLAHMLAPAADCGRRWPAVLGGESPLVVLVARETIEGLSWAHDLLRQWCCGQAGDSVLVGLITCAHQPGKQPKPIRQYLSLVSDLLPEGGLWRVEWQPDWPLTELKSLPTWTPRDQRPAKGPDPLAAVRGLGESLFETLIALKTAADQQNSQGENR